VLSVKLLGELELRLDGVPLAPLGSARAESLLAYLVVHRGAPVPRQRLAFVLWPDSSEAQARTNLRHVLHKLRRGLPGFETYVEVGPRTLRWRDDAPASADVDAFLAGDLDAYRGDLLEGSYDEWAAGPREELRAAFLEALERAEGLAPAERLIRADPLRESAYRRVMALHAAAGDRARALRASHALAAVLDRELGTPPSAETRAVYEALLREDAPATASPPASPSPPAAAPPPAVASPPATASPLALGAASPRALVGRSREVSRLDGIWAAAKAGRASFVVVSGEPGIGKTRLLEELRARAGGAAAEARSYAAEGAPAYAPVVAWLRSEPLAARRSRLDPAQLAELARVLPELGEPPAALPPREQRRRLFEALAAAVLVASPLLLIADDIQWADPETLAFIHFLIRAAPDAPLLVAASARREELDADSPVEALLAALYRLDRAAEVALGPLSPAETAALAGRPLAPPLADRLFEATEGNPLFALEALRAGLDGVSPRVQAVIEARLAQLSPAARELAGVAAVIGREFTAELLSACGDGDIVGPLDELWRRRIIRDHGSSAYDISHDRIREVAYAALSAPRRRDLHRRVAAALRDAGSPGVVAAHYDRAGAADDAVEWYARAADAAQSVGAYAEAIRVLDRALELHRGDRELSLLVAQLPALATVEGFGAPRLAAAQERALALSGREPAAPLLRSIALSALSADDFERSREIGRRLRDRGETVEGEYVLGISAFWLGELQAALAHFEAAIAASNPADRARHLVRYGLDPEIVCRSRRANTLALLGLQDTARRACEGALELAHALGHAPTTATAHVFAALLALDLGDQAEVRRHTALLDPIAGDLKAVETVHRALRAYVGVLDGRPPQRIAVTGEDAPGARACVARVQLASCEAAGDAEAAAAVAEEMLGLRVTLWHDLARGTLGERRSVHAPRR
jgi:DNA-binding SARP family transcriptional activator